MAEYSVGILGCYKFRLLFHVFRTRFNPPNNIQLSSIRMACRPDEEHFPLLEFGSSWFSTRKTGRPPDAWPKAWLGNIFMGPYVSMAMPEDTSSPNFLSATLPSTMVPELFRYGDVQTPCVTLFYNLRWYLLLEAGHHLNFLRAGFRFSSLTKFHYE